MSIDKLAIINGLDVPNFKYRDQSQSKDRQYGKYNAKLYSSQSSPFTVKKLNGGNTSNYANKYEEIKPKVYDHFSRSGKKQKVSA